MDELKSEASQNPNEADLPEEYTVDKHAEERHEQLRQLTESKYGEQVML